MIASSERGFSLPGPPLVSVSARDFNRCARRLTGRAALGIEMPHNERFVLTVGLEEGVKWDVLHGVHALLQKLLPGRVMVTPLLGGVQPDGGVEVFLC